MGIFDFLKPKAKLCSQCQAPSKKRHTIYSGAIGGDATDNLCNKCLLERLKKIIFGSKILFFEPITDDSYTYGSVGDISNELLKERMNLAYNKKGKCFSCSKLASHLWITQDDLDHDAMEKQKATEYYNRVKIS